MCASFLANKYGLPCYTWNLPVTPGASNVWKIIHNNLGFALNHSRWIINGGDRFFWLDNWSGSNLWFEGCSNPYISIKNALLDNTFRIYIPNHFWSCMQEISFNTEPDKFICTLNSSGAIKTADIYDFIRDKSSKRFIFKFIWNSAIPPKISVFMWRALNKALPVDVMIQRKNISLASKCCCCSKPDIETIEHLFIFSETAIQVWNYYSKSLGFYFHPLPFSNAINLWMSHADWNSQYGSVIAILGNVIPWSLWNMRNQVRFGKGSRNLNKVFQFVNDLLSSTCNLLKIKNPCSYLKQLMLSSINIKIIKPVVKRGKWHNWTAPSSGLFKLNTDGSHFNNSCAGGGVIRNSNGELILAYSVNIGQGDCNFAEAKSLMFGLKLCLDYQLPIQFVEMDSKLLIDCLNLTVETPWNLSYIVRSCRELCAEGIRFIHSVREGNMLADCLSKHGHDIPNHLIYHQASFLNSCCYNCFISDQLGLSYFRPP